MLLEIFQINTSRESSFHVKSVTCHLHLIKDHVLNKGDICLTRQDSPTGNPRIEYNIHKSSERHQNPVIKSCIEVVVVL